MIYAFFRQDCYRDDEAEICSYAEAYGLEVDKVLSGKRLEASVLAHLFKGDVLLAADVSVLGQRFEEALRNVVQLASYGVRLHTVKESLSVDTMLPQPVAQSAEMYLKLYKGILSLRNRKIQEQLSMDGRKRGRPFKNNGTLVSLEGKDGEIISALSQGMTRKEIAARLGCGRTALFLYMRRKNIGLATKGGTATEVSGCEKVN